MTISIDQQGTALQAVGRPDRRSRRSVRTIAAREVELVVEYAPHMRSVHIEVDKTERGHQLTKHAEKGISNMQTGSQEPKRSVRGDAATNNQHLCVEDPLIDVLYRALGNRTGRLRVSDTYRICGIDPGTANRDQVARLSCAIRELGWARKRRRYNGKFDYAYVKGNDSEREVELVVEYDPHTQSVRIEANRAAAPPAVSRVSARGQPEDLPSTQPEEREGYPARLPVTEEDPIKVTVRSGVEILRGRAGVGEYEPDEPDVAVERHVVSVVVGADAFESRHASFDEARGAAMRAARLLGLRGCTYEVL